MAAKDGKRGLALARVKKRERPAKVALPELAQHERDAASFWYRRIATSLLIGNGAGIIAVAGFVGKTDSLTFAAPIAYPALTLYFTGVAFGFGNFFISLFWSSFRIETYTSFYDKLEQLGKKVPKSPSDPGKIAIVVIGIVLILGQLGMLVGAGICFYLGSAQVVGALGRLACASDGGTLSCSHKPSFMFGDPSRPSDYTMDDSARYSPIPTFVDQTRVDGSRFWTVERLNLRAGASEIKDVTPYYLFRLVGTGRVAEHPSCLLEVADWFSSEQPPLVRNPATDKFLATVRRSISPYHLEPLSIGLAISQKTDGKAGFDVMEWDVTEKAFVALTPVIGGRSSLTGIPGNYRGGLLVYPSPSAKRDPTCLRLASNAGFETID